MTNRLGGDHIVLITIALSVVVVTLLVVFIALENKQMQMQAFEKCLQNNIELAEKNTTNFPVSNNCRL